jgi:hypothetical protein
MNIYFLNLWPDYIIHIISVKHFILQLEPLSAPSIFYDNLQ